MKTSVVGLLFAAAVFGLLAGCSGDDDDDGASAPESPAGLTTQVMGTAAHLQWTDPEGEDELMIERRMGAGTYSMLTTLPFDSVQHMDNTAMSGMTYTYRITAMNDAGMSAPSNESTVTMP